MQQRKARLRAKRISFGRQSWGDGGHPKCTYGWSVIRMYEDGRNLYQQTCWRRK
jgi:hypothetical protein